MTVIAGAVGSRPRRNLERACRESLDAQSLYGRDPKFLTVDGASFGIASLATTAEELDDGQPLASASALLIADCRIDNRTELLALLADPQLSDDSADSDVLMAAWRRWNHAMFQRVIGAFAIAIFDPATRSIVLARGPSSDRPLCYRITKDGIRFASMPSGLTAREFSPNLTALAHLMVSGDMALGETAFADVAAVPPAHYLEWCGGRLRLTRFWRPPAVDYSMRGDRFEEFRHLLDEIVACRLRRLSGPIASHLSGGLDSTAVTATTARLLPDRRDVVAFTMAPAPGVPLSVPPHYIADETDLAAQTAAMLGIEQQIVTDAAPLLDCLRDYARVYQAPVPNVPNQGWGQEIYRRAAETGAKVLFSATFGNANVSFGGGGEVLSEWLRRRRFLQFYRQADALVGAGAARWRGAIFYSIADFLPRWLSNAIDGSLPANASDLFIRSEWLRRVERDRIGSDYEIPGLRKSQYAIYADGDYGIFTKATLGKYGIDEREPTADTRLMDFCLRLPPEYYICNGVSRRLAREGLADRLPPAIIANYVRGFQGADWFAKLDPRDALEWIEEISVSAWATELVDLAELRRAVVAWDQIGRMPPAKLRQWGNRFTRALAVGSFLYEAERDIAIMGRKSPPRSGAAA
jgi:asparagine synthase (glutamine-hydrolysing)